MTGRTKNKIKRMAGRLATAAGLLFFTGSLSAQTEHWQFSAIATGMEAPFFKEVYAAPGVYRIHAAAEGSSTDFIADSLSGKLLLLMRNGDEKKHRFYGLYPDSSNYFAPCDLVDLDAAQIAVNPSGATKTAYGLTLIHLDLYLGGKAVGEAWVAQDVCVPGAYAFALPDGRHVTLMEIAYDTGKFYASKRFVGYEVLESVPEDLFSTDVPDGE